MFISARAVPASGPDGSEAPSRALCRGPLGWSRRLLLTGLLLVAVLALILSWADSAEAAPGRSGDAGRPEVTGQPVTRHSTPEVGGQDSVAEEVPVAEQIPAAEQAPVAGQDSVAEQIPAVKQGPAARKVPVPGRAPVAPAVGEDAGSEGATDLAPADPPANEDPDAPSDPGSPPAGRPGRPAPDMPTAPLSKAVGPAAVVTDPVADTAAAAPPEAAPVPVPDVPATLTTLATELAAEFATEFATEFPSDGTDDVPATGVAVLPAPVEPSEALLLPVLPLPEPLPTAPCGGTTGPEAADESGSGTSAASSASAGTSGVSASETLGAPERPLHPSPTPMQAPPVVPAPVAPSSASASSSSACGANHGGHADLALAVIDASFAAVLAGTPERVDAGFPGPVIGGADDPGDRPD